VEWKVRGIRGATTKDWDSVPLLDLQQMDVPGSLENCIRILIQVNSTSPQSAMNHSYLREAEKLRPDLVKS